MSQGFPSQNNLNCFEMKVSKPFALSLPAKLVQELDEYLLSNQPHFKCDLNYFYWIIHYIQEQQIKNKDKSENAHEIYIPISMTFIRGITISKIDDYMKILKNGEFIECDNQYMKGEKSRGYRINPKFLIGNSKIEIAPGSKLFNKILKNLRRKKAHYNRQEPFLRAMADHFMKMDMDYLSAEKWATNESDEAKRTAYLFSLEQLKDKRFRYFKRNNTNNRLDTNLTNLKSNLKGFIVGDYVSIDLKNSQPFLLGELLGEIEKGLKENKQQGPLCCLLARLNLLQAFGVKRLKGISKIHQNHKKAFLVNLNAYMESVNSGTLYDDFVITYGNRINRDEVKDIMFKVLFSKNKVDKSSFIPYEQEKEIFASVYPLVYEAVKQLKERDNVLLPVFLQKLESYIFIDCIARELVSSGIIPLTIHDSVIVRSDQQDNTLEIIHKVFNEQFGVVPKFKIKHLKDTLSHEEISNEKEFINELQENNNIRSVI